jgi:transcriptional regulator with XRE-family HTH domain
MPKQGYAIVGNDKAAKQAMGRRIQKRLTELGMNQSDLARAASKHTPRGKPVGRDSISGYIRGRSIPNAVNLHAIAAALKMAPEDILPEIIGPNSETDAEPAFSIQGIPDKPGRVWLRINQPVGVDAALEIMGLIKADADEK